MSSVLLVLLLPACEPGSVTLEGDTGKTPGGRDTQDSGTVAAGDIQVSPTEADLGVIFVGGSANTAITVENIGDGPVEVTLSVVGGHTEAWTADQWTSAPEPGASAVHTLTLTPTTWGDHSVSAVIEDAESGGRVEIPIAAQVQVDEDADGYGSIETGGEDCDDQDGAVNPGATETWYDGIDSDCAGDDDFDQDADGVTVESDCVDTDATVFPGATETWYDGIDSDCAGDDDYDQDADGYVEDDNVAKGTAGLPETGHLPGGDCDDLNAMQNPGMDELWYDGIDGNCDGADDYDQDGDGVQLDSDCDDTDASVYPGAPDTWYDGVDSDCAGNDDYDQDGDGYDWPTDCNDTDPTVTGPVDETLNGIDDDCDGFVDDLGVDAAASGAVYGSSSNLYLGDHGTIAIDSDLDGDGAIDLVVATDGSREGNVWIVDGATAVATAGLVTDLDSAQIDGDSAYYPLNWVNGPFADVDGDGAHDLVVGGALSDYSYGRVYGFAGGSGLSGTIDAANHDVRWSSDSDSDLSWMGATGDLDGDGLAEVVIGSDKDNYGSGSRDTGTLCIFAGGSFSGDLDLGDADDEIWGDAAYDYLGSSLVMADMTGDGLDDIIAGASGYDGAGDSTGSVYLVPGKSSLEWDTFVGESASASFAGSESETTLGADTLAHPGDVDGDGALDLGLTSETRGEAWIWLAAGAMSGSTTVSTADHSFSGTSGDLGSMLILDSDLDGDGADEIVLGADGDDTAGSNAGAVFVFRWSAGLTSELTSADAAAAIWGAGESDYFGTGGAGGQDLDGDGLEDLAIGAAQADDGASNGGAVYLIRGW